MMRGVSDETRDETVVTRIPKLGKKGKQAYIVFLSGPLVGKIHLLEKGTITLGRSQEVDIPINDLGISRQHLQIEYENGRARLKDMGSTNGTYLNGQRVMEAALGDGDKIQISSSTIIKYARQDQIENIFHNELYRMAVVDALTGAYNKRFFSERLREEFSYCRRNNVPLSLLMIDLDYFKKINDRFGHPAGDFVLARIATLAKSIVRTEDVLARYGGEEFTAILKGTDATGARTLAERLRKLVEETQFPFDDTVIRLTLSIGIATLNGSNFKDPDSMIKAADKLLYEAKKRGRDRVVA